MTKPTMPLDYSKLSFVDDAPAPVPVRRLKYGWARLYYNQGQVTMETDYVHPEPSLNELANRAILKMKARWYKFYKDRGEEPYDYDYVPPEYVNDYEIESSSSESAEDPEDNFSD